jgi:muramoyltetrapeptide carboxypeptidase
MCTRAGVMSIHGTMCSLMTKSRGAGLTNTLLRDILYGIFPEYVLPAHPLNRTGTATGILVGGNLFTSSPVLGTGADATANQDIILFIEEVEEDMSHLDRIINTLRLNGVFDRCKGVILGDFTDCEANLDYSSVEELICSYLEQYDIPVICGFPGGHGDVNLPLVMGANVTIDVRNDGATLQFNIDGDQQQVNTADITAPVTPAAVRMRLAGKLE